ncbi:MAG TPA: phosphoribosyltransferase family protein [Longimicrobium sp.]|nr:phosphoribosyltransferase family protein [Longimicrobium sp.]
MTGEILDALPVRRGHFLLESGYHTDLWLTLDAMFVDTRAVAPLVAALAEKLRSHGVTAVCGPMLGGAFLAQAVATLLGARFYFTEPAPASADSGLFRAKYTLPSALRNQVAGERVAVVDDVISAGSSVRATVDALAAADASTVAVGALLLLGDAAREHFAEQGIPVEAVSRSAFSLWAPDECPLCRANVPMQDPRISAA